MSSLILSLPHGAQIAAVRVAVREALSTPFVVSITAHSADPNLPLAAIVGHPATLHAIAGYAFAAGLGTRVWSGVVRRAAQAQAVTVGGGEKGLSTYEFEIVPRLALLAQRRNHRIFQHLSIPDIADEILGEWHIPPTWHVDRARYPRLEYKVQYGESDLAFLARLLEEAGITYLFEGQEGHGSRLILRDAPHTSPARAGLPIPFVDHPNDASEKEYVTKVRWAREVRPGQRALRDYDFRNPSRGLLEKSPAEKGVEGKLERHDYHPGGFRVEPGKGGDTPVADDKGIARYDSAYAQGHAARDLAALRAGARSLLFEANAMDLAPGVVFSIDGHPHAALPASAKLLVTAVEWAADVQGEWKLRAEAVPAEVPYRPPLRTPKPVAHGFQSAKVVGPGHDGAPGRAGAPSAPSPAGQEIHTDEFGRVRVQFPWDRKGKSDDRSSCWVRVNEGWGGLGYGMSMIPRIGQEVLVSFLHGDPEEPLILGRAYNQIEQVPYKLPSLRTRSTWKSNSSLGGHGFNEIMYEDLKGQELVWEHAEKDRVRLVKNDETATVVHDREVLVKHDLRETTEGYRKRWVGKDADLVVKQARRERIERDSHVTVQGDDAERVDGSQSLTVLDDQAETVGGRYALKSGKQTHLVAGEDMVGEAQDVTLKGPGGFLRIDSAGVTIVGKVVKINAGGAPGAGRGAKPEDPKDPPSYEDQANEGAKPAAQKKALAKGPVAECEIASVTLSCEHDDKRKYRVQIPAPKDRKPPVNVLEVLAADHGNAEKIKTAITLAKPRCASHKPHSLAVVGHGKTLTKAEDTSTVEVYYSDEDIHGHTVQFFWPWKMAPVDYTFTPSACHGPSAPIVVRVYPNVEPSLSLEFALDTDERVTKKVEKAQGAGYVEHRGRPAQTAWKFAFKAKVKYGTRAIEVGYEFESKIKKLASVNLLVKRAIDLFVDYFYKFTGVTLLPVFPKLSIAYEGKFKEIEGSHRVGAEWSILLKADPLLGITAKFEILELMIKALGKTQFAPIATGLEKIRKWAKDKGQKFEITLSFTGQVGGEIGAKKNVAAAKAGFTGAIEGKVKAEFAAAASFGSKGVISFQLGAEVKADTGISVKVGLDNDDKGVFLKGKMTLLACKLKYAAWASGKVFWEIKESFDGEHTFWEDTDFLKSPDIYVLKSA